MVNLDAPSVYRKYDPDGMMSRIHEVPEQCRQAWQKAMDFSLPREYTEISKVVILGMGGSAIGGTLVSSLAAFEAKLPILVHRDYDLPALVDGRTLVIASSYSGMTEETLSAFEQSLKTGAKKLAITTGGKLKETAEANHVPVFIINYPAPPRAALPYSLLPILAFLQKLGIVPDKSGDVAETIVVLEKLASRIKEDVPSAQNAAKQLAQTLFRHLPVIYGAGITAAVAYRWKTQLNENSKAWAFHEVFPEVNHNGVVGNQFPAELSSRMIVVLLRSTHLSRRVLLRYRITGELLDRAGVSYQVVDGEGASPLSQMMSLVLFGDYVSYYLAMLYQTDPTPVRAIDYLKEQLAQN